MSIEPPDLDKVNTVADELLIDPAFIEKDWYVTAVLEIIGNFNVKELADGLASDMPSIQLIFSGGTCLSKGWLAIERFSEDIDFKLQYSGTAIPNKTTLRNFRHRFVQTIIDHGFELESEPEVTGLGLTAHFKYQSQLNAAIGIRKHIKVELTYRSPTLASIDRSLSSLVERLTSKNPDSFNFACVDVLETACDKLSALAWRVCGFDRSKENQDATIIRHLYDLAMIKQIIDDRKVDFCNLINGVLDADAKRGNTELQIEDSMLRLTTMLDILTTDTQWSIDYERYVLDLSYAENSLDFVEALNSLRDIVGWLKKS
jgi:predicted nucleotidyltransferase component of viral defense system